MTMEQQIEQPISTLEQIEQPLWQRLTTLGDRLHQRGETLTNYRLFLTNSINVCWDSEALEISILLHEAQNEVQQWRQRWQQALQHTSTDAERRTLINTEFQFGAARLRVMDGVIGNCVILRKVAKDSGLAGRVNAALKTYETGIATLVERRMEMEPGWQAIRAEFLRKLEDGDLVFDPILGWIDNNNLVSVGPAISIVDISTPVALFAEIDAPRCPICLEEFTSSQGVVSLACRHFVHAECLDSWVNSMAGRCNTCVVCRNELFPRRRREPSEFISRYTLINSQYGSLNMEIQQLHMDSLELTELLTELQPDLVSRPMGH